MKIALIGYGKMGQAIEGVANSRGHQIVLRITSADRPAMTAKNLKVADVAIEFTNPSAASDNILECLSAGVSVVSGTTGWNEQLPIATAKAKEMNVAFLHASNFSIGVNIFFEVNQLLARLMNGHPEYDVAITETHHLQKKDAPSGTAITLAQQIIAASERLKEWGIAAETDNSIINISSFREGTVPGTHTIKWSSDIDAIEITHTAKNRTGFAVGAVLAAEYIKGKQGVFCMRDVLGIGN